MCPARPGRAACTQPAGDRGGRGERGPGGARVSIYGVGIHSGKRRHRFLSFVLFVLYLTSLNAFFFKKRNLLLVKGYCKIIKTFPKRIQRWVIHGRTEAWRCPMMCQGRPCRAVRGSPASSCCTLHDLFIHNSPLFPLTYSTGSLCL